MNKEHYNSILHPQGFTLITVCGQCPFASKKTYEYTRKNPNDPYRDAHYIFEKKCERYNTIVPDTLPVCEAMEFCYVDN